MILFIISTCIIAALIYILVKQHFSPLRHLANPEAWPLVHQIPLFLTKTDHLNMMARFCQKYKKEGVFRATRNLYEGEAVYITNVEDFKMIMSKPEVYHRIEFLERYFPLTGNGLMTATGKQHESQKKLVMKAFSSLHLKNFVPAFNKHSAVLVKVLQDIVHSKKNGCNIEIQQYLRLYAFDVMGQIGFGYNFEAQISNESKFVTNLYNQIDLLAHVKLRIILDLLPFLWRFPFGPARKLKKEEEETNEVLTNLLEKRKRSLIEGSLTKEEDTDLLSMMIKARDDETNKGMNDQLIRDNSYTLLVAGYDTTSITLTWCLLELAKHPEHQQRAREEVLKNLKKSQVAYEDMTSLPFLRAFIKEVIRVHPAVPLTARVSQKDVTVRGHVYPKGTLFALPLFYYNIDNFENGTEFQPERFMDVENNTAPATETFTFAYGPYSCIGKKSAMIQMKIVVAHLLKHFEFSVDPGNENYIRSSVATVVTDRPITIRIKSFTARDMKSS